MSETIYDKIQLIRLADLLDVDTEEEIAIAVATYNDKKLEEIFNKIKHQLPEARRFFKDQEQDKPKAQTVLTPFNQAKDLYKKLSKTLKFELLKETVILEQDYACFCCDKKFPPKESFKIAEPKKVYPLFVRCNFPIIKYIEVQSITTLKELFEDKKIFDKKNYLAICDSCKPSSLFRRK